MFLDRTGPTLFRAGTLSETVPVRSLDKTFNLGEIHVTVAVYKNLTVVCSRTNEHPLFIVPLYLHGHSDAETYSFFFSHIASRLLDCPFTQLTFGEDEEQAISKFESCIPWCTANYLLWPVIRNIRFFTLLAYIFVF